MDKDFIDIKRFSPDTHRDTRKNIDRLWIEDGLFFERHPDTFWTTFLAQNYRYCRKCKDKIYPKMKDLLQQVPLYCKRCAELLNKQAECDHYFILDREYNRFRVYICEKCAEVRIE